MSMKENCNPNIFQSQPQKVKPAQAPPAPLCPKHAQKIGCYFCSHCLSYSVCQLCLQDHSEHSV